MARVVNFDTQVQEYFNATGQSLLAGDVVSLDPTNIDKKYIKIPVLNGEDWVLGVVSENTPNNKVCYVAKLGQVWVRADNSSGAIAIGDMLTCKGGGTLACKAGEFGYTIGYALEPCDSATPLLIKMEINTIANTINAISGGGTGTIQGATNVGTGGIGLFSAVNGVNLEFKNINAKSNKILVTNDNTNKEVDIDLDETKININNLLNTLSISKGGTNNTSYTIGKFLAFDGTKLVSTPYDQNSFSNPGESPIQNASNIGIGGVGLFKEVSASSLSFKNINAGNSSITITDDTTNNEVDIAVNPAGINITGLAGTLTISKGGTNNTSFTANRFIMSNSNGTALISSSFTATSFAQDGENIGTTTYVGVFKQKSGTNLQFKGLASLDSSLTITDLTANNVVNLTVNPAAININGFNGVTAIAKGGTNNTTYTEGKFLVFDGSKIASSIYDQNSFSGEGGESGGSSVENEAFAWFIS